MSRFRAAKSKAGPVSGALVTRSALAALALLAAGPGRAATADPYSDSSVTAGFMATVFGVEYPSAPSAGDYVKKFTGNVRVYVDNHAAIDRRADVQAFVSALPQAIGGLSLQLTPRAESANFIVHVVDRSQYATVARHLLPSLPPGEAPGRCFVSVTYGASGIARSEAVIVSDEGEYLFRRCMVEEILQGLGPVNDSPDLSGSVFSEISRESDFVLFDRLILSALYHPAVRPGMSEAEVARVLPGVLWDIRRSIR
ncbi:MAG: DUF2927 domain-containing protein [Bauldia sp.]|nr:DUF2927 domain-containing protein [Bauldia sp.]